MESDFNQNFQNLENENKLLKQGYKVIKEDYEKLVIQNTDVMKELENVKISNRNLQTLVFELQNRIEKIEKIEKEKEDINKKDINNNFTKTCKYLFLNYFKFWIKTKLIVLEIFPQNGSVIECNSETLVNHPGSNIAILDNNESNHWNSGKTESGFVVLDFGKSFKLDNIEFLIRSGRTVNLYTKSNNNWNVRINFL